MKHCASGAWRLLCAVGVLAATAAGGEPDVVVRSGDPAPGTAGGTLLGLRTPNLIGQSDVVFNATVGNSTASEGIFLHPQTGAPSALVLDGDPVPGVGVGTFSAFKLLTGANRAPVAFEATVSGGTTSGGLFLTDLAGNVSTVALVGDLAPGLSGIYESFGEYRANANGDVVFQANLVGGSSGVFLAPAGGAHEAIALEGDPAPGSGGGTFSSFSWPDLDEDRDVTFVGWSENGVPNINVGIYLRPSAGGTSPLVLDDPPLFGLFAQSLNASGTIAFNVGVDTALFRRLAAGATESIVEEGETAPCDQRQLLLPANDN